MTPAPRVWSAPTCPGLDLLYFYLSEVVRLLAAFLSAAPLRPHGAAAVGTLIALQRFFNMIHVDPAKVWRDGDEPREGRPRPFFPPQF